MREQVEKQAAIIAGLVNLAGVLLQLRHGYQGIRSLDTLQDLAKRFADK